jgi:uncharacterized protein YqgC (DUF456 family)
MVRLCLPSNSANLISPNHMKLSRLLGLPVLGAVTLLTSCVAPYPYGPVGPNQAGGTAIGATGGAVAGAIIGSHSHIPVAGAVLGGLAGAVVGSATGRAIDYNAGTLPPPPPPPRYYYAPRPPGYYYNGD